VVLVAADVVLVAADVVSVASERSSDQMNQVLDTATTNVLSLHPLDNAHACRS